MLIESRSSRVYSSKKKMFLGYQKRLYFGIHLYLLYGTWAWAQPRNKLYPYRIRTVKSFSEKMILNTYAPTMKKSWSRLSNVKPMQTYSHTAMWVNVWTWINVFHRLKISNLIISKSQTLQMKMTRMRYLIRNNRKCVNKKSFKHRKRI